MSSTVLAFDDNDTFKIGTSETKMHTVPILKSYTMLLLTLGC